jgi:hypothetical protein
MTKKTTKKRAKPAKKSRQHSHGRGLPHSTDLAIIYTGGLNRDRDREIRAVVEPYDTGSGFGFGQRDITATVPDDKLPGVIEALKKIPGIEIKKSVVEWVVV